MVELRKNDSLLFATALSVASVVEEGVHLCVGTILTGFHLLTLCTCTTVWNPLISTYLSKSPDVLKAIGGAENLTSRYHVERRIRYNFPHPYCGGNLSNVDLAVLQLWDSWPFTSQFEVSSIYLDIDTTYFDYMVQLKHLSNPTCQTASWWRYSTVQAPASSSPKVGSTGTLKFQYSNVVDVSFCLPFDIEILGKNLTIRELPKLFKGDKLCVLHQLEGGPETCGVDKGAPLECYMDHVGWILYGIGLGGSRCTTLQSLSLFQGFSNSLSFMRLYKGIDLVLRNHSGVYVLPDDSSPRNFNEFITQVILCISLLAFLFQ